MCRLVPLRLLLKQHPSVCAVECDRHARSGWWCASLGLPVLEAVGTRLARVTDVSCGSRPQQVLSTNFTCSSAVLQLLVSVVMMRLTEGPARHVQPSPCMPSGYTLTLCGFDSALCYGV